MYPTDRQMVDEAEQVLAASSSRDMYAEVLVTAIAGQLNERERVSHYESRSGQWLLTLVAADSRYVVRHDDHGLPLVCLV